MVSGPLWCLLLLATACLILPDATDARPSQPYRFSSGQQLRRKRVSDQRLAELETLLALAKIRNRKYFAQPVGFGLIDVDQIGRRKRRTTVDTVPTLSSSSNNNNQQMVDYIMPFTNQYRVGDVGKLVDELSGSSWSSGNLDGDSTGYSQMPKHSSSQPHHSTQERRNEDRETELLASLQEQATQAAAAAGQQQRAEGHMALHAQHPQQQGPPGEEQMTHAATSTGGADDSLDTLQYQMLI